MRSSFDTDQEEWESQWDDTRDHTRIYIENNSPSKNGIDELQG